MVELLTALPAAVVMLWLTSIEWRWRNMNNRISETLKTDEIKSLIDLKQSSLKDRQKDIKEDINRLEAKIDKLIELNMK